MKPLLVIRHERTDTLGVARVAFEEERLPTKLVDVWANGSWPGLGEVSGLLVLGGAMNVDQVDRHPYLAGERELLREALRSDLPVMGVCLGAQLMARAMDQPVVRAAERRCGFYPVFPTDEAGRDPMASIFSAGDLEFHWNEDTFELPREATLLASSPGGTAAVYRVGERAWGIAFHPEVDRSELDGWIAQAGAAMEPVWGRSAENLRKEAAERLPEHEERGRELFRRFARCVRQAATG